MTVAGFDHPYTIRAATPTDAAAIVALIDSNVASGELLPRTFDFVRMHAEHFIVAEAGGRVVGCVHLDEYAPSLAEVRSLAVAPDAQGMGLGAGLVAALERLARVRGYHTVFAVSNSGEFFRRRGYEERHIPELDRERSAVSKYKGVHAKDLAPVASR
ncbi:MAG TPA: GNAT family N-acetyltransferase [Gemmatimonadaceae bacterium]|nr:GNAT family N-acetyltransferase [Gemmatimonadaceae bacterium]